MSVEPELTLQERLAKRGINWSPPQGHEQVMDVFRRLADAMIQLMDQVDRDYPKRQ